MLCLSGFEHYSCWVPLFDGTNPITGKGVSYSIPQRFWVMLVS